MLVCVFRLIDFKIEHAAIKEHGDLFSPDPSKYTRTHTHIRTGTLQQPSLTIRCCKIDGHSEIDLRPRRGRRGGQRKRKVSDGGQHMGPHYIPALLCRITNI